MCMYYRGFVFWQVTGQYLCVCMYYKALDLCFGRSKDSCLVCICSTKHWFLVLVGHQIEALCMYILQSIGFWQVIR